MTPASNSPITTGVGNSPWPMVVMPKASPASPMPDRMKPLTSSGGRPSSRMLAIKRVARKTPISPTGMLIQKIQRQEM